ncbi:hypothetical protein BV25DRAFT_1842463 [Artomyces pyxidatus]|uniref:Uncharacterized protein n=1 Tax=Artomyces pyxidatus TaxID=48021 RepID=A0ACB8SJC6_9AGAM|nr:hypothetical protein BV25DRAFT_1842463 [Artomyces pyxidatus]
MHPSSLLTPTHSLVPVLCIDCHDLCVQNAASWTPMRLTAFPGTRVWPNLAGSDSPAERPVPLNHGILSSSAMPARTSAGARTVTNRDEKYAVTFWLSRPECFEEPRVDQKGRQTKRSLQETTSDSPISCVETARLDTEHRDEPHLNCGVVLSTSFAAFLWLSSPGSEVEEVEVLLAREASRYLRPHLLTRALWKGRLQHFQQDLKLGSEDRERQRPCTFEVPPSRHRLIGAVATTHPAASYASSELSYSSHRRSWYKDELDDSLSWQSETVGEDLASMHTVMAL